ncbi:MAG: IS21 family transposase [Saprospiraceae bacterium]
MAKTKRMDQIRTIISSYQKRGSIKEVCRILNISKNTVRKYLRALSKHNVRPSEALLLSDETLAKLVYESSSSQEEKRLTDFESQTDYFITELRRVGVTRQLLWEEYLDQFPSGYRYSQFCEHLKKAIGKKDLTIAMEHVPGEVMQLDFAGKHLHWVDINTGEHIQCEVLIAVFPHSQYTYAIALPSQQIPDFIYGINQAFLYFGGLPKVILSDNLKSYVTKSDNYEPKFTHLCEQLGAHFQVDLQATRPRKPKDKASVENAVQIIYNRIYGPLRNETFFSIEELNQAIETQLERHNRKDYQKKQGNRNDVFHKFERPQMRDLPTELFEIKKTVKAKVQRNYHVMLGEDSDYYSVPYQHVGASSQIVYTRSMVCVYIGNQRVASHNRLIRNGYNYQTKEEHLPKKHQKWKEIKGYDAQYFLAAAQRIGPSVHWAIQRILLSRVHEAQAYNSCQGVMSLARKYSDQRLENAAAKCLVIDNVNYSILKRILEKNLDQAEEPAPCKPLPEHDNIRGAQSYQ